MKIKGLLKNIISCLFELKNRARIYFIFSLVIIGCVFASGTYIAYNQFSSDVEEKEFETQQQWTKIFDQLLTGYFYTIKYITEYTTHQPEFYPKETQSDTNLLYQKVPSSYAKKIIEAEQIKNVLVHTNDSRLDKKKDYKIGSNEANSILSDDTYNWQLFKALPDKDINGKPIAEERRKRAKIILETNHDIHYVFQMLANGDLIFLEPYDIQKNISIFNYNFRDYLHRALETRKSSISEGYISNDPEHTQIITVAAPICDGGSCEGNDKKVTSIFAASISSSVLRETVFKKLKENMGVSDGTVFYLIDRHGHVVASSSGKNIYYPEAGKKDDTNDPGNVKQLGFFKSIKWHGDFFEKENLWGRESSSWDDASLKKIYQGEYTNLSGINVLATFYPTGLGGSELNWGILIETPVNQVLAAAIHLRHVFYISGAILCSILAFLCFVTIRNFSRLEKEILAMEEKIRKVTAQLAHDIKSPLVSLTALVEHPSMRLVPEEIRVTANKAVNRVFDIAHTLVEQYKKVGIEAEKKSQTLPEIVAIMLDGIIAEKNQEYRESKVSFVREFNADVYGVFSSVNATEFKRAISNLLNNAVEATKGRDGLIIIKLVKKMDALFLTITDNGCGVSNHLIPRLLKGDRQSIDISKQGAGLGLSSSVRYFESWGCKFDMKSEVGKGTTIEITLPQVKAADWFMPELKVHQESMVVVLDDDESIHDVWDQRFKVFLLEDHVEVKHFTSAASFDSWFANHDVERQTLYLMDYELRHDKETGLDLVEKHSIANYSVLVSSRFEDVDVRKKCNAIGLKAIPKDFVRYIPIDVVCINPDIIFIDDDESVIQTWKNRAKDAGKKIAAFNNIDSFLQVKNIYKKETPIYIDSDLNDKLKGEIFAKELYDKGYLYIYLATGFEKATFSEMPWIVDIVSKKPPF